ncbi:hypothetical protein F383_09273 [Gossypium arboreum]|uniref:Uncharacterized protein n=1 Tax=Gossypium arboreum TaxID=29729 RepID=A0A0B0PHG4_GOSAR|nr:hypothetical protein F383_18703 [Gossypium arboreum]KHG24430.1 hypothetical protein F383_09273 [Gossypium arboreum]
MAYFCPHG